jgi:hypothetical protein
MPNISYAAAAAALGVSGRQLNALMRNPACPAPTANAGSVATITFDQAAVTAFAATLATVKANGWKISTEAQLSVANFTTLAATSPGASYTPALADPLFDNFP